MAAMPQFRAPKAEPDSRPVPKPPQPVSAIPVTGSTSYEMMTVGDLLALPEADFHPPLNEKRIAWYAEHFDADVMEPPSVAVHYGLDIDGNDITGQLVIYEGRHRLRGALAAKGADWVTLVRVTRGERKAAELFASLNGSRRSFGSVENYNARLSGGGELQLKVKEIAEAHGFTVGGTRINARGTRTMGGRGIWHINAIGALYDALGWGEEVLEATLGVIAAVTEIRAEQGQPDKLNTWTSAKVIQGVAYLLNIYENEVDAALLVQVLSEVPPYVAAPVDAHSAGRNAYAIVQLYNAQFRGRGAARKRLRTEKIPLRYRAG